MNDSNSFSKLIVNSYKYIQTYRMYCGPEASSSEINYCIV